MKFFYVTPGAAGTFRILDQDDVTVMDFVSDWKLGNRIAFRMNIGVSNAS